MTPPPSIRIAAALIHDDEGRMLLVRKRGTTAFMQPGGKLEPGESAADCLARELDEELGIDADPTAFRHLGRFSAPAANEPGHVVDCDVFEVHYRGAVLAAAEIEESRWFTRHELADIELAPLTRDNFLS